VTDNWATPLGQMGDKCQADWARKYLRLNCERLKETAVSEWMK